MEEISPTPPPWSLPIRIAVLVLLALYLGLVVLAPMTIPSGSPFLTTPIAQRVLPAQQALYLNHGYRFFAPNPGPTHVVVYEIETADGQKKRGHFPDRDNTSPRLLYHRWFMLSESVFREFLPLSEKLSIPAILKQYDEAIAELARAGEVKKSEALAAERDKDLADLAILETRFEKLMLNLARNLVKRFGETDQGAPKSIRMWIRERKQPTPEQSLAGVKLTDESVEAGLLLEAEVAYFTSEQLAVSDEVADSDDSANQPELESIAPAGDGDE